MSKHMTIINLACTITKVRKWGEGWKHSAESAHAAFAELHRKHKEAERIIETLRANLTQTEAESRVESLRLKAELAVVKDERDQLRVERDALLAQLDTESAPKPVDGPRSHPVKVGEWVRRTTYNTGKYYGHGVVVQVVSMGDIPNNYVVKRPEWEGVATWDFQCCEPCDPPTEADHDTPAGKAAAESAVKVEPKPGDTVRLVRVPTVKDCSEYDYQDSEQLRLVSTQVNTLGKVVGTALCEACARVSVDDNGTIKAWPLSCVEIVKGGE